MPYDKNFEKGTLAGFDAALSISNEAINKQLEILYDTPVSRPVTGGPKHLIDHELHLHDMVMTTDNTMVPSPNGLDAYICCPKMLLNPDSKPSGDASQTVRVAIKFRKAESSEISDQDKLDHKDEDSWFSYNVVNKFGQNASQRIEINGWELTWEGIVKTKTMADVMTGIIEPPTGLT
jgi:hypothetical protein